MKQTSLSLILDAIFIFFAVFCLLFTVFRFFLGSLLSCLLLSVLISATVTFLFYMLKRGRFKHQKKIAAQQKQMSKTFVALAFLDRIQILEYFKKVFEKCGYAVQIKNSGLFLEEKKLYMRFNFSVNASCADALANTMKGLDLEKSVFVCGEITAAAKELAASCGIKTFSDNHLFSFIEQADIYPQFNYQQKHIKKPVNIELSRRKAKTFLFFGIMLLFYSMYVAFALYYLISSAIMVLTALFLKLYRPKNPPDIKPF